MPIWTTLTHQGYKVGLHHWSRCDIEFSIEGKSIKPEKCDPYSDHTNDGTEGNGYTDDLEVLKDALDQAVEDLANEAQCLKITKNVIQLMRIFIPKLNFILIKCLTF